MQLMTWKGDPWNKGPTVRQRLVDMTSRRATLIRMSMLSKHRGTRLLDQLVDRSMLVQTFPVSLCIRLSVFIAVDEMVN